MNTLDSIHLTVDEFWNTLANTPEGDTFVYFTGELSATIANARRNPHLAELIRLQQAALDACGRRRVHLTQKRVAKFRFDYCATKVRFRTH